MAAFYMVKDADRLIEQFDRLPPAAYRDDFVRLRNEITDVWNAFLRGFLLLGLALAVITFLVCEAIGLSYSIGLGLLAGLMEFVPSIGPFIAGVPAVLLALFQETTFLGMSNIWYAVLVAVLYLVIQQIEGNVLLPRILGRSLNLHPLLVLIAIVVGGSLAGILGMLLAAPVLATIRVVGSYVYCRLYDRDPFARLEEVKEPPKPGLFKRAWGATVGWLRERRDEQEALEQGDAEGADSPGEVNG
jgi:predicted PurR-regulated permease PerM